METHTDSEHFTACFLRFERVISLIQSRCCASLNVSEDGGRLVLFGLFISY